MTKKNIDDQIMQISKEIIVKFIEGGKVYPANFHNTFELIYQSVNNTIKNFEKLNNQEIKKNNIS